MLFPLILRIHVLVLLLHGADACMMHLLHRDAPRAVVIPAILWLHVTVVPALEVVECPCAWRHGRLQSWCAGELLEFPHVLPLLFGGHFVVGG